MDDLSSAYRAALEALAEAEVSRGAGQNPEQLTEFIRKAIQSSPAQFENREDDAAIPVWALVSLLHRVSECAAVELQLKMWRESEKSSRSRLAALLPKRSQQSTLFDEYLDIISGEYDGLKLERQDAVDHLAEKHGKSYSTMYRALQRELAKRRASGEMDSRKSILPSSACRKAVRDKNR